MHQETRCGDERAGGDDEYSDAIDRRADDFHELAKIFHERLLPDGTPIFNAACERPANGGRWIGWKARPLLRIRYGSEDDATTVAEGATMFQPPWSTR
jgi:hypothetical protein